jgi:hypothetical protein
MKRSNIFILIISILVLSSLIPSFVNAEETSPSLAPSLKEALIGTGDIFAKVIGWGLLNPGLSGEDLFAKALLFILLISVLYSAAQKLPVLSGNNKVAFLVALVVTILGIRFLDVEMIKTILLPYNALAISIAVLFPFMLFFYVIQKTHPLVRKISWAFFSSIMMGLWLVRWDSLGDASYIYLVFAIISFVVLLFDGFFHRLFASIKHGKEKAKHASLQTNVLLGKRSALLDTLSSSTTKTTREKIKNQIKELDIQLKDLQEFT